MNYFGRKFVLLLSILTVLFFPIKQAQAHVQSPQQVVEDKYIVQLLVFPQNTSTRLQISFWDKKTGKNLTMPISYRVKMFNSEEKLVVFRSENLTTTTGTGEFIYNFLPDKVYPVAVEFEKADEPHKMYVTKDWWLKSPPAQSAVTFQGFIWIVPVVLLLLGFWGWRYKR